jgi:hypothetical protein
MKKKFSPEAEKQSARRTGQKRKCSEEAGTSKKQQKGFPLITRSCKDKPCNYSENYLLIKIHLNGNLTGKKSLFLFLDLMCTTIKLHFFTHTM